MKKKIFEIKPGQFDAFTKALKRLPFLKTIQIYDSGMSTQVANNAWLCVNFSITLGGTKANFAFMNSNYTWKELASIPNVNAPIEVYEIDKKYVFTNGKAYVRLNKYAGFNKKTSIPSDIDSEIEMGTASVLGKSDTEILFKLTKNKGPIDFIVIEDELVGIGNHFGSRFPVTQNTVKDILDTEPTSMYRSFSFDKLDGKIAYLELFKVPEGHDLHGTWLHAQITIDTAITFNFFERLIPISKHNWHN